MDEIRGSDLLSEQLHLESAARRKFPWNPEKCTHYMDIPSRQLLFACLTCHPSNAICYACGIRCHSNHCLVELDTKRTFRCDCGTGRINNGSQCSLRPTKHDPSANDHLTYCQNFEGRFCECHEHVNDSSYGHGAMFQCLVGTQCGEDWFHARCIAGISRDEELRRQTEISGKASMNTVEQRNMELDAAVDVEETDAMEYEDFDESSDESSGDELTSIFPELPSNFGALVCPNCAKDVIALRGSEAILANVNGYSFLKENYGDIISNDPTLASLLREFPFLGGEEACYKPAKDEDNTSMLEAGERALNSMPHEAVINGITKFNQMKDELMVFLRDIGTDGRAITKEDVELFFGRRQ